MGLFWSYSARVIDGYVFGAVGGKQKAVCHTVPYIYHAIYVWPVCSLRPKINITKNRSAAALHKRECLTHPCPRPQKPASQFWWNLSSNRLACKIFEGEMLNKTIPTTLLQIFRKIIPIFKVIVECVKDPDDSFKIDS